MLGPPAPALSLAPSPAQEQIPILCGACGGPTTPLDEVHLRCPYCGHQEQLPASAIDRNLELKKRIALAAARVAQLGGMASALGTIYEDPWALLRVALPYGVVLAFSSVTIGFSAIRGLLSAAPGYRAIALLTAFQSLLPVLAIALGPVVALAIGRFRFRRRVRPLLTAKAPLSPGAPARCRACGGALPPDRGPYLRCRYCMTTSLVTPELARDRERLLAEEAASYQQRTNQVSDEAIRIGADMNRLFTLFTVGGVALTWVFGFAMGLIIEALLAP